jgi:hypothetical protein
MLKRPHGRGGLYKRGRVWWLKYYVDRYPVFESAKTRDKKRAEDLLKQRLAKAELNQLPDLQSRKVNVEEVLTLLLSDYRLRNRASVRQLESRITLHLIPLLGPVRVCDFGHRHVDAYVRQRRQQKTADASINRELEHLRAAMRLAVDHEVLSKAPEVRMLDEDNVRSGFLEHQEYEALRAMPPPYLVPLFVTGYHVGSPNPAYCPRKLLILKQTIGCTSVAARARLINEVHRNPRTISPPDLGAETV